MERDWKSLKSTEIELERLKMLPKAIDMNCQTID